MSQEHLQPHKAVYLALQWSWTHSQLQPVVRLMLPLAAVVPVWQPVPPLLLPLQAALFFAAFLFALTLLRWGAAYAFPVRSAYS